MTPNLSVCHHPVTGALLVTDCGLAADESLGYRAIFGTTWGARVAVAGLEGATAANVVETNARLDLVVGMGGGGPWHHTSLYNIGRIDWYEGVPCAGICGLFAQRFMQQTWGPEFPSNWYLATTWEEFIDGLPVGFEFVATIDKLQLEPGDCPVFWQESASQGHIGVVDSHSGGVIYYASSNYNGDYLGHFDAVPEDLPLVGFIRHIAHPATIPNTYFVPMGGAEGPFGTPVIVHPWDPTGTYAVGGISTYEGVGCYGRGDEFIVRFLEAKWHVHFEAPEEPLPGSWAGPLIDPNNIPDGIVVINSEDVGDLLPGDAAFFHSSRDGIVHSIGDGAQYAYSDGAWHSLTGGHFAELPTDLQAILRPTMRNPHAVGFGGRHLLVSQDGPYLPRFRRMEQSTEYRTVGSPVPMRVEGQYSPRYPYVGSIGVHPHNWRLFVAEAYESTLLYSSPDQGANWHQNDFDNGLVTMPWVASILYLQYPAILVERGWLWLVGYMPYARGVFPPTPEAYRGANGRLLLYRFQADATLQSDNVDATDPPAVSSAPWDQYPTRSGSPVTVGATDAGKPAIIRRPDGMLVVLAPKVGDQWTDVPGETKGIVEYVSGDDGKTWALQSFQSVS